MWALRWPTTALGPRVARDVRGRADYGTLARMFSDRLLRTAQWAVLGISLLHRESLLSLDIALVTERRVGLNITPGRVS